MRESFEIGLNHRTAVTAAAGRDEHVRWSTSAAGRNGRPFQVTAVMSNARYIRGKLVFPDCVEDRLRAVDPDFVVVVANDFEAVIVFENLTRPARFVENVAHAEHE